MLSAGACATSRIVSLIAASGSEAGSSITQGNTAGSPSYRISTATLAVLWANSTQRCHGRPK
jgi:hypothetical protein